MGVLLGFLDQATDRSAAAALLGEPGIGKTIVWRAVCQAAEEANFRVLRARPTSAEVRLSFAAMGDLIAETLDDAVLPGARQFVPKLRLNPLAMPVHRNRTRTSPITTASACGRPAGPPEGTTLKAVGDPRASMARVARRVLSRHRRPREATAR